EPRAAGIFDVLVDRGGLEAAPRAIEPEAGYLASRSSRHQRGQIAPEIVGAEVGLGAADPGLGAAHVLDHERDISASGLAGFALDAELSPEQGHAQLRRPESLRPLPGHRPVAELLAGRGADDQFGVLELRAVE